MKKLIVIAILFMAVTAQAETVMSTLDPVQVVQSGNTCHSAAVSEILVSTGWAMSNDPEAVFQDFTSRFGYGSGWPERDLSWYLGYYYPEVQQSAAAFIGYGYSSIQHDIDLGYGTIAVVNNPAGGLYHDLEIVGYEEDAGIVTGLYYVNSWYAGSGVQYDPIGDGFFYRNGQIQYVVGLINEEDYVAPAPPPYQPPSLPPPVNNVPEPGVVWLLAFGIGMMIVGRSYALAAR